LSNSLLLFILKTKQTQWWWVCWCGLGQPWIWIDGYWLYVHY